ncbi:MAG: DUF58 domain-containing protein [Verrucomicrobiales bacterium]
MSDGDVRPTWFERWIHASYRRGSAWGWFLGRRVTPLGWLVMALTGVSALLGLNVEQGRVYVVFGLLTGMIVVAFFWAFFRRGELRVSRELPEFATAGEEMRYTVNLENTGARKLAGARLREESADFRPGLLEFVTRREPREEKRNGFDRLFAYYRWKWLAEAAKIFTADELRDLPVLRRGEKGRLRCQVTPLRRGVVRLADVRLYLPDPFGFFQRCRRTQGEEGRVLVLPKRYHLPEEDLPGQSGMQSGGEASSVARGAGGEFMALRDYRTGDPLRHIHWRTWARTGRPIVIEHEEFWFPRYGLVLDTSLDGVGPEVFEEAVSVAASYVSTVDTRKCLLDLMFVREGARIVTAGQGVGRAASLLEVLAMVEPGPPSSYEELGRLVLRYEHELTALIVVLTGWSEARAELLRRWASAGLDLVVLVVCEDVAAERKKMTRWPAPVALKCLAVDRIQEDLWR